jgi:hypothetical protein
MSNLLTSARRARLAWVGAFTLAATGACRATTGPSDTLLLGQWGSSTTLLVALRSGAEVQLRCAVLIIDQPIAVNAAGAFVVQGHLEPSSAVVGSLPKVRGSGQVNGSHVTLMLPLGEADGTVTYQLEAGVRPEPLEVPECPL